MIERQSDGKKGSEVFMRLESVSVAFGRGLWPLFRGVVDVRGAGIDVKRVRGGVKGSQEAENLGVSSLWKVGREFFHAPSPRKLLGLSFPCLDLYHSTARPSSSSCIKTGDGGAERTFECSAAQRRNFIVQPRVLRSRAK